MVYDIYIYRVKNMWNPNVKFCLYNKVYLIENYSHLEIFIKNW